MLNPGVVERFFCEVWIITELIGDTLVAFQENLPEPGRHVFWYV